MRIQRTDRWLDVQFAAPQHTLSWALHNGGFCETRGVTWLQVHNADLPIDVDPLAHLRHALERSGRLAHVGLMTSCDLGRYVVARAHLDGVDALCVATVGLSNALRVGDPPGGRGTGPNTINLLCWASIPLAENAMLEAMSLAAEARTLAVHEGAVASTVSGRPATGTGTDCIVIASPAHSAAERIAYAGKHTVPGHLVGDVVTRAVAAGVKRWLRARADAVVRSNASHDS